MIDEPNPPSSLGEAELERLFTERLPQPELSAEAQQMLTLRVLDEVQRVFPPQAPELPAAAPSAAEGGLGRLRRWLGQLRPGQSLLLAGAGAAVLMLVFVSLSRLAPRPLTAVATVTGGDAMVLRAHNDSFRIYGDGDVLKIQAGDHILTEGGVVTVTQFANQVAVIEPGAHVEYTTLDDANGGTQVELYVHDGAVRNSIDEPLDANDRYVVHAPNVAVTAHGTEFSVEALSDQETLVTTLRGVVEVTMGDAKAEVQAGQAVDALVGRALIVEPAGSLHKRGRAALLVVVDAQAGYPVLAAPQENAATLAAVQPGQALQVTAEDESGGWYQVCCIQGKAGWVRAPIVRSGQ